LIVSIVAPKVIHVGQRFRVIRGQPVTTAGRNQMTADNAEPMDAPIPQHAPLNTAR
jgi:hypothetical protein